MNAYKSLLKLALYLALGVLAAGSALASTITVQGKLLNAEGAPLAGERAWEAAFHDGADAGAQALGAAATGTVTVGTDGRFSLEVMLTPEALAAVDVWYDFAIDCAASPDGTIDPGDRFDARVHCGPVLTAHRLSQTGPGSGLDADTLDGVQGTDYATDAELSGAIADFVTQAELAAATATLALASHTHALSGLDGTVTDAQVPDDITVNLAADADTLDGVQGADYATDAELSGAIADFVTQAELTAATATLALASHTHALSSLGGTVNDAQVPNDITIDYAADAGTLDGLVSTAFQRASPKIIEIHGDGTDLENGTALYGALDSLSYTLHTESTAVIVKLGPGIYDLGSFGVDLPVWVNLQGAGRELTIIRADASADDSWGAITCRGNNTVRDLTIECDMNGGTASYGIMCHGSPVRLVNVRSTATNAAVGVEVNGLFVGYLADTGEVIAENCMIESMAGGNALSPAVEIRGDANLTLRDCTLRADGGTTSTLYGIYSGGTTGTLTVDRCRVELISSTADRAMGIAAAGTRDITISRSDFVSDLTASLSTSFVYGIFCYSASDILVEYSSFDSRGGDTANHGVTYSANGGTLQVLHSRIVSENAAVQAVGVDVDIRLGMSQLEGTAAVGVDKRTDCIDGNFDPLADI